MNGYRGMKACFIILLIMLGSFATSAIGQDISDEARKHMDRGLAAAETAKTDADFEDAIKEFNKAAELAPAWADVYYNLGLIQEQLGKDDDALRNLRKYVELSPNATDTQEVKQRINKLEYKKEKEARDRFLSLRNVLPIGVGLVGIELSTADPQLIVGVTQGMPAAEAGIKTGDRILRVDGKDVKGLTIQQIVELIRGQAGSKVTIQAERQGEAKPLTFTLIRKAIIGRGLVGRNAKGKQNR
jgi:C-terminal processing protease CtpA/Prc